MQIDIATIKQNRRNGWTLSGIISSVILFIISTIGLIVAWPIKLSFQWLLLPILWFASLIIGGNYLYWMIFPRDMIFAICKDNIHIEDQFGIKWDIRDFEPLDVIEIACGNDSPSYLMTRNGKRHPISDILMMQKDAIFEALTKQHPHILLKEIS